MKILLLFLIFITNFVNANDLLKDSGDNDTFPASNSCKMRATEVVELFIALNETDNKPEKLNFEGCEASNIIWDEVALNVENNNNSFVFSGKGMLSGNLWQENKINNADYTSRVNTENHCLTIEKLNINACMPNDWQENKEFKFKILIIFILLLLIKSIFSTKQTTYKTQQNKITTPLKPKNIQKQETKQEINNNIELQELEDALKYLDLEQEIKEQSKNWQANNNTNTKKNIDDDFTELQELEGFQEFKDFQNDKNLETEIKE